MDMPTNVIFGTRLKTNPMPAPKEAPKITIPGQFGTQNAPLPLTDDILSKHMMLIGGTGCGKTNTFYHIVSELKQKMTDRDVMIIFDTKGDFYRKFFNPAKDCVIGNSREYRDRSVSWNLFREIAVNGYQEDNFDELYLYSREIAKAFFDGKKSGMQPFFVNAATEVLSAVLYQFLCDQYAQPPEEKKRNLTNKKLKDVFDTWTTSDICAFIADNPLLRSTVALIGTPMTDDDGNFVVDDNGNQIYENGEDAQNSVYTELLVAIRDILTGVFAREGAFSIQKFVRNKGAHTLFIEYDLTMGSVLTPAYRLLIDLALKEALGRESNPTTPHGNVYLVIDELKLLPSLQHLQDAVNFGRSLGVKVMVGLQSITQLQTAYGDEAMNIVAGFSTVMSFRANDYETRAFTTNRYGKNILIEQLRYPDGKDRPEKRDGSCVEDWDVIGLQVGEAIIGLPDAQPFRYRFKEYKR